MVVAEVGGGRREKGRGRRWVGGVAMAVGARRWQWRWKHDKEERKKEVGKRKK